MDDLWRSLAFCNCWVTSPVPFHPPLVKGPEMLASVCDTRRVGSSAQVGGGHFCGSEELGGFLLRTRGPGWTSILP